MGVREEQARLIAEKDPFEVNPKIEIMKIIKVTLHINIYIT